MTSMEPVVKKPLPPLAVGDRISVRLHSVNKNGNDGIAKLEDEWLIRVNHAPGKEALVPDQKTDVVITRLFPGGAEGTQA